MSQNIFSDDLLEFIDEWKDKPGNLIMVLHRVQSEVGYISREAADEVSRLLDVPLSTIWGVVTFYHFFKLTKPGKYNIQVCLGTAWRTASSPSRRYAASAAADWLRS